MGGLTVKVVLRVGNSLLRLLDEYTGARNHIGITAGVTSPLQRYQSFATVPYCRSQILGVEEFRCCFNRWPA